MSVSVLHQCVGVYVTVFFVLVRAVPGLHHVGTFLSSRRAKLSKSSFLQ